MVDWLRYMARNQPNPGSIPGQNYFSHVVSLVVIYGFDDKPDEICLCHFHDWLYLVVIICNVLKKCVVFVKFMSEV